MAKPLVSAVMPAYNDARFVSESIDSVLGQTFQDLELIVIDDGSTDGTRAVVASRAAQDARLHLLCQGNRGPAAARNNGLRHASGDYVAFIDADDLWVKDKLEKQLNVLEADERSVSYSSAEYFYNGEAVSGCNGQTMFAQEYRTRKEFLRALLCGSPKLAITPSVMFRKDILKRTGLFDEDLLNAEDLDLWVRMADRCDFRGFREPLFKRRKHAGSLTSGLKVDFMIRNHRKILDKYCRNHPVDAVHPHRIIYAHHYLDNAYLYHSTGRDGRAFKDLVKAFSLHPVLMTYKNLGLMKDICSEGVLPHGGLKAQYHHTGL